MQKIDNAISQITNDEEQIDLAKRFYNLFLPFSVTINRWMTQVNEIKDIYRKTIGIKLKPLEGRL